MSERIKTIDASLNELQVERQARDIIFVERIKRLLDLPEVVALKNRCPIGRLKHVIVEWESYRTAEETEYNRLWDEHIRLAPIFTPCHCCHKPSQKDDDDWKDDATWTCPDCGVEWLDGWHVCHNDECIEKALKLDPLYKETEQFKMAQRERAQE